MGEVKTRSPRIPREERQRRVLDTAAELFYERGVHEVGMDELVRATGLGKATVYRLFATKDDLIAAYLQRLSDEILSLIDDEVDAHAGDPAGALRAIFRSIAQDLARPTFRGCAFNNASIEFADPEHPARVVAREYRRELHVRLRLLSRELAGGRKGDVLAAQLAVVVDGMYTNAAHLGPGGPAASGPALANVLLKGV